jgi:hypothetical protein
MADNIVSLHQSHSLHANSLTAYREERPKLNGRKKLIYDYISRRGPCTDREIMSALGFSEPNAIRPRCTELLQMGLLTESDSIRDDLTGKRVRRLSVNRNAPEQRVMFA